MDDARFDAWTRRRFGLAAGGFAGMLLAASPLSDAVAGKRKRKRCVKLGNACRKSKKARRCCSGLACDVGAGQPGRTCCQRQRKAPCNSDSECCGIHVHCSDRNDDPTLRCCGSIGASCGATDECCGILACDAAADPAVTGLRCCLPPGSLCVFDPGEPDLCCAGSSCSGASKCE